MGSEYIVILNDSPLRDGLIARAKQSGQSSAKAQASVRLRFGLARAFCALGSRIEPRAPHGAKRAGVSQYSPTDQSLLGALDT